MRMGRFLSTIQVAICNVSVAIKGKTGTQVLYFALETI